MNRRIEALVLSGLIATTACAREDAGSQTQVPTSSPERATPAIVAPTATEKAPDQGWSRFRSLHYPYQIDYPRDWSAQSTQLFGKKLDVFKGEVIDGFQINVNVLSEPVNTWVNVEDYVQNYLSQVEQIAVYGKESVGIMDRDKTKGLDESKLGYRDRILYNLIKTDVAKNKTYMVNAYLKHPLGVDQSVTTLTAIFIANGQGWQVTFSSSTKLGNEAAILGSVDKFQQMLASFRLIAK